MYFNSSIRPVNCNINATSTCTCISIQASDRSTTIKTQQLHVFQFDRFNVQTLFLLSYLLQCISLHYYALLLLVQPCPDGIQVAHNLRAKLFIYLVSVAAEAGHIGGTAPVRELFINEYFLVTVMFYFYLS